MALFRAHSAAVYGIDAHLIDVEVDLYPSGTARDYITVGMPDTAVRESRERVRSAIRNCGYEMPHRAVVINLAPADLRKEGNHLDLAIALGMLVSHELLPEDAVGDRLFCGELGLDGSLRPVRGALALAELAAARGSRELVLPAANAAEAAALGGCRVIGVAHLSEVLRHLLGQAPLASVAAPPFPRVAPAAVADLSEVRGQAIARRGRARRCWRGDSPAYCRRCRAARRSR
jgi:magnesium chelatase family protein